jgi:N-hydroxyarylamine O-acetyltransferase
MTLRDDDLAAYFERIEYAGLRAPTLPALRGIIAGHATCIPFENLDVLIGRPIRLDPGALADKLVRRRRGGYCFEHNMLLLAVLRALGFAVEGFAARVLWGRPKGDPGPRTHMLLRVRLPEGDCLADVGFGGLTLTAPLRFELGPEQATPHEPHRLVDAAGEIELQARLDGDWSRLYRFLPVAQLPIDYEVANWFTSTYPAGLFTNNLLAARPEPDRRHALFNRDFTIRHRDGRVERRVLADAAELAEVLTRFFRVALPDPAAEAAAVWQRLAG